MNKSQKIIMISLGIIMIIVGFLIFISSTSSPDCAWYSTAVAWIDENENAKLDQNEKFLPGVAMHIDDIENKYIDVADPVSTNENGDADLTVWLPGCPNVQFEVYADIPEGYRLTTNSRFEVRKDFWGTLDTETTYYFGFVPEN